MYILNTVKSLIAVRYVLDRKRENFGKTLWENNVWLVKTVNIILVEV